MEEMERSMDMEVLDEAPVSRPAVLSRRRRASCLSQSSFPGTNRRP